MSIGLRIKELRSKKSLSQDEFASSIGIKRGNLGQIEIGNQLPTLKIITDIVKIYNTTYTFLIEGEFDSKREGEVSESGELNYNSSCPRCADKERIISLLEEKIESLKSKIEGSAKGPESKNDSYSQTG